jgi:hypothetical protein
VINVVVQLTIAAWLALEVGLQIRDRVRGKGSAAPGTCCPPEHALLLP